MHGQEPLSVFRRSRAIAVPLAADDGRRLTASRVLAAFAAAALIAFIVTDLGAPRPARSSVEQSPPAKSPWIEVMRAQGAYEISSPALASLDQNYITRRHRDGGGRQDIITFGSANAAAPFVRVALYRPGTEGAVPMDPVEAVASVAAEAAIDAEFTGPKGIVITKFGDLAIVEMKLSTDAGPRTCLAAAGRFDDPQLGMVAWFCNPGIELVAHGQLACIFDRLTLVSSGRDEQLIDFFAKAELNRSFCDTKTTLLGNAPRAMPGWIDTKAGPRLRGKFSER